MQGTDVLSGKYTGWPFFYFLHFHVLRLKKTGSLCGCLGLQSCAGWQSFLWFCISVVLVGFDNYERSLGLERKRWFSCLLCNLCTQDDMLLTSGSDLLYDLGEMLPFFLTCFSSSVKWRENHLSPRWGEQSWCTCMLWDPWQGATEVYEIPIVLLGFRCRSNFKEQLQSLLEGQARHLQILVIDPSGIFPPGVKAWTGCSAKCQHWCFWRSRRAFRPECWLCWIPGSAGARGLRFTTAPSPLSQITSLALCVCVVFAR